MKKLEINCNEDIKIKFITSTRKRGPFQNIIVDKEKFSYGTIKTIPSRKDKSRLTNGVEKYSIVLGFQDFELVFLPRPNKEECIGILNNLLDSISNIEHNFITIMFSDIDVK